MNRAELENLQTIVLLSAQRHIREFTSDYMRAFCINNGFCSDDVTVNVFGDKVIIPLIKNRQLALVRAIPAGSENIPIYALNTIF